jgi:Chaperone of endosialidase
VVNSAGQLGVVSSSRRYKQDITDMGATSNPLLKLRPVTFRYKEADDQGQHPVQYGLIAEEVAEVMPELVVRDEDGRPETVAYHTLSSLLLNEYQQQHRDMQALASAARAEQEAAAQGLVRLEQKLASRDQELVALRAEMAKLARVTQQLQAALPLAQPLATSQP